MSRGRGPVRRGPSTGEGIAAGDQVITGLVVQVPAERGREIVADLGPLGAARLAVAPYCRGPRDSRRIE